MRGILVGDIHIDNVKTSIANSDSFTEVFQLFDLIRNTIYEEKPDFTIFFGDIFNSPNSITSSVMSIISKLIAEIALDTTVLFIVGNHDDVDNKVSVVRVGDRDIKVRTSLLAPFAHYQNVVVFDSPKVVKIQDGVEVAFIPYSTNIYPYLDEVNKKFSVGTKRILMGHFDIFQTYYMQGYRREDFMNIPTAEELVKKYKYDLVLLGHVHDQTEYNIDGKKVMYIGSSRNVDFRNTGENKGLYLLDFNTLKMKYIDNPYTYVYKIFNKFEDLEHYCKNNELEKLSRTKILYKYSSTKEVQKVSKLKEFFKSVKFVKSTQPNELNQASLGAIHEFEELLTNNLLTSDQLIDYALQFKEPPTTKEDALNIIKYVKRR